MRFMAVAAGVLVIAGCSSSGAQVAADLCAGPGLEFVQQGWGVDSALVGSTDVDAKSVETWLQQPGGPVSQDQVTFWQSQKAGVVAVCYYSGDFSSFPGPPDVVKSYVRMMILIPPAGDPIVQTVGPSDVVTPNSGPTKG